MKSADKIILVGLKFYGYHGVLPEEKKLGQWFEVDIELTGEFTKAASSDQLEDTLDYSQIYGDVRQLVEGESLNLLESLTSRIADKLMEYNRVEKAMVRVKKPGAPLGGPLAFAAVEMVRDKCADEC